MSTQLASGRNFAAANALLAIVLVLAGALAAEAKEPQKSALKKKGIPYEGLSAKDCKALVGITVDVVPRSGKTFNEVELVQVAPGKLPGTLRSIAFTPSGGGAKRTLQAKALSRLIGETRVLELMPEGKQKNAFLLVDVTRRDGLVSAKLKEQGEMLWPPISEEERSEAIEENKALLKKVENAVPDHQFQLTETKYYLFCTDVPQATLAPLIADLDNMYLTLGQKFGAYEGENIWRGKAMVAVFSDKRGFVNFERIAMNIETAGDFSGYYHALPKGDVLIAAYITDDPNQVVSNMIHDTTRGYLYRYRSTVYLQHWVTEGIAEWVTINIQGGKAGRRAQQQALETLRTTGNLAGLFKAKNFDPLWQWGAAGSITDVLLKTDAQAYRQFIQGMKEGLSWEDSLRDAFAMSGDDLAQLYGQEIGLPNLRP